MPAPPPMRFVSRADRTELLATRDAKSRLKTTINLAEEWLTRAENLTQQKKFNGASEELGAYMGLIGDLRAFIETLDAEKSSTRDLYKHFEIGVRPHIPRIAVMRRTTPVEYSLNLKETEQYIKDTREHALDSFYGHSVLRSDAPPDKPPEQPKEPSDPTKRP